MLFSSVGFVYYFLPIVLVLYFGVPDRFKNSVLLLSSLFFYFYGEPVYSVLMIISCISGYLHGVLIARARGSKYSRLPLVSSVVIGVGILIFFKYLDFFIANLNWVFGLDITPLRLALPIGISFYTFQVLSYTIDVYRGDIQPEKNLLNFATYVSLFPQLIAGPIVRYSTIESQMTHRTHSVDQVSYGIKRFVVGLSKKVLLANNLGELVTVSSGTE